MGRLLLVIVGLLLWAGASDLRAQGTDLIFTASRSAITEVVDAVTLDTVARVHFDFQVERLSASADGSRLEVAGYAAGGWCCQHYTLDPATWKLEEEVPASERGDYGACLVSPDGRWCFQLKSFRGPALKVVDLREPGSARVLIPPGLPEENSEGNWAATGVWSADRFYLYVQRPNDPGRLWTVSPGAEALGPGIEVAPFGEAPGCRARLPVSKGIVASAGNVFLYEPFGSKADRTGTCGMALPGGVWMLDATTGRLTGQVASEFHFNRLIPDASGSTLYGVALDNRNWNGPVQIVRLNGRDGTVMQTRTFEPGVLQITAGRLAKVPVGNVSALPALPRAR
jgi:hypothetical protein